MFDETTEAATTHNHHSFKIWLGTVAGIIIISVTFYGVFLVRQYLPVVGYIWLIAIGALPTIGLCFLLTALIKYILKADFIEVSPNGHIMRIFGHNTEIYPLGIKEYKTHGAKEQTQSSIIKIPDVVSLLRDGAITSIDLLLGFHIDGTPRYGTWDDVRTFIIAGKSRSGKTCTTVFFLLQALLAGATLYVCDLHYRKKDGLLNVLEPLIPFMKVARTETEILNVTTQFRNEMHARETGKDCNIPCLYIVDEWTYTLRNVSMETHDLIIDTYLDCAEAYAAFNGFSIISGHEWTSRESGGKKGTALRRNTHSVFVHKLDEEYAKFLLQGSKGKKLALKAPELTRGCAYMQDSDGVLDTLYIPYYGVNREGIYTVVEMLRTIDAAPSNKLLTTPDNTLLTAPFSEIPKDTDASLEAVTEMTFSSDEEKVRLVQRLRKRNIAHRDIAYSFGWYGARYNEYQAFCKRYNIPLVETAKKEYAS